MWRIVTFEFTGKSNYSGTFAIEVDNNGVPIITQGSDCNFVNISGDEVALCTYSSSQNRVNIENANVPGAYGFNNFTTAVEGQTYTETDPDSGTWSYTAVSSSSEFRQITFSFQADKDTISGVFVIEVSAFTGVPVYIGANYNFSSISGNEVIYVQYSDSKDNLEFYTDLGRGILSSFSTAVASQTYTESEPSGTWSYVIATSHFYTITSSAGVGGTISPSGSTIVYEGSSQAFTITPSAGYKIASVLVDGTEAKQDLVNNVYTFTNVSAVHTITAIFEEFGTATIEISMDLTGEDLKTAFEKFVETIVVSGALNLVSYTYYDVTTGTGTITITETDTIPDDVFQSNTHITSVVLPECFTTIDDAAFAGCTNLETITLPDTITTICADAFSECNSLTSLELPASVIEVGEGFLDACESLETLTCNSPVPPTTGSTISTLTLPTLIVPNGSVSAYQSDLVWGSSFVQIIPKKSGSGHGFNVSGMIDTDFIIEVYKRR